MIIEKDRVVIADFDSISAYSIKSSCGGCEADILFESKATDGIYVSGPNKKAASPYASATITNNKINKGSIKVYPVQKGYTFDFQMGTLFREAATTSITSFYNTNKAGGAAPIDASLLSDIVTALGDYFNGELKRKCEAAAVKKYVEVANKDLGFADTFYNFNNYFYSLDLYKYERTPADASYIPAVSMVGKPNIILCPKGGKFSFSLTAANGATKEYCASALLVFKVSDDFGFRIKDIATTSNIPNNSYKNWNFNWGPYESALQAEANNLARARNAAGLVKSYFAPNGAGGNKWPSWDTGGPVLELGLDRSSNILSIKAAWALEDIGVASNWWYSPRIGIKIGAGGVIQPIASTIQNALQNPAQTVNTNADASRSTSRTTVVQGEPSTPTTNTSINPNAPISSNPDNITRDVGNNGGNNEFEGQTGGNVDLNKVFSD